MEKTNSHRETSYYGILMRLFLISLFISSSNYSFASSERNTHSHTEKMHTSKMHTSHQQAIMQPSKKIHTIKGFVYDAEGLTLPGATVRIHNSNQGTITNIDGRFKIRGSIGDKLIISYVGMTSKTIKIKSLKLLKITLDDNTELLDEVVVTGYQTISRERATGSYNILKKETLEKPASNIASRLIGTSTGLQATLDEDGNPKFEIRGLSSLGSNASPLIVVDGFAIDGDFNSINPNDVESVTVLKDAAAASIWGARSANGVIVVTTKSGKKSDKGKINIQYSNFFKVSNKTDLDYVQPYASAESTIKYDEIAFQKRWGFREVMDSKQYLMSNTGALAAREAMSENYNGYLTDQELATRLNALRQIDNREQIEKYILQQPFTQQHNLALSFSNEKVDAYSSLLYEKSDKALKRNYSEKAMFNFRSNFKISKKINFDLSSVLIYNMNHMDNPGLPQLPRYQNIVDKNGNYVDVPTTLYMPNLKRYVPMEDFPYADWGYNPITEMNNTDISNKALTARLSAGLNIKIIDGLTFKGRAQYELRNDHKRSYYNDKTYKTRLEINQKSAWNYGDKVTPNLPLGGMLDQNRSEYGSLSLQGMLNFKKDFNEKHAIAVVAGIETNSKFTKTGREPRIYGYNEDRLTVGTFPNGLGSYTNPDLYIYNWVGNKFTIPQNYHFTHRDDRFFSAYANANYTYDGKYSVSASVRTDASNLITDDPKYRYAPFWSVGGSWQIGSEEVIKEINWIDRLTLRATYGYNGNIDRSTSFKALINASSSNDPYSLDPYATISSFGNPSLRWEKTGSINLGIDFSLFKGKLFGGIDYYNKKGTDLIASNSIPSTYGTTSQRLNTAEMVNQGIELQLGSNLNITKGLNWRGNLNVSYNFNKITKLFNVNFQYYDIIPIWGGKPAYVEGESANSIWGVKYNGITNIGTEENPNLQPNIIGKDNQTYTLNGWPSGDALSLTYNQGTSVAPWVVSLNSGFNYKGFDLSFIITGKFGHVFQRTSYNYNGAIPNKYVDEVMNADPSKMLPLPPNDDEPKYYFWNRFYPFFTYLTESADLIRMQEIALSYDLPSSWLRSFNVKSMRLYGQVNNAFSIFANDYDEDPEFKLGSYKPQPSFTVGVSINL